ncbi:hypothetical protein ABE504_08790 [Paenibacillus oryzisoli]|uniref:hypothetical protein n=1 Tax=Paenibacillus oryzisoli TaxID=1850517 RepID=UPI003D2B5D9C
MRQVFANGGLQRHLWIHEFHEYDGTPVTFEFEFDVSYVPQTPVSLGIEQAELFEISLNGAPVSSSMNDWFLDRSIILPTLQEGRNCLTVSFMYTHPMKFEDCYLIGDFALTQDRAISKEPATIRLGDWCLQGYLHYCGSIIYHFDYKYDVQPVTAATTILELGDYQAVTVDVRVNDHHAGYIPWTSASFLLPDLIGLTLKLLAVREI